MIRVAIFTDVALDEPGGIPSTVRAQKKALEKDGFGVTVFCPGVVPTRKFLKIGGARVAYGPRRILEWLEHEYPAFDFDIVHVHYEASCGIAGVLAARKYKKPLVITMHGREDRAIEVNVPRGLRRIVAEILNWTHAQYLPHKISVAVDDFQAPTKMRAKMWELMVNHANYADAVLAPSRHFAEKLRHYGVPAEKVGVVSGGIDDEILAARLPEGAKWDGKAPLKIIWHSRVSHEKRLLEFLRALSLTKTKYELDVFGNGNELAAAKKFVREQHLNVRFCGNLAQAEILQRLPEYHLDVMASVNFDTFGLTIAEAITMGVPVFFCDEDMKTVVPLGCGICAESGSACGMAKSLDALTPQKLAQVALCARENRRHFAQKKQIEKLEKVYSALTE